MHFCQTQPCVGCWPKQSRGTCDQNAAQPPRRRDSSAYGLRCSKRQAGGAGRGTAGPIASPRQSSVQRHPPASRAPAARRRPSRSGWRSRRHPPQALRPTRRGGACRQRASLRRTAGATRPNPNGRDRPLIGRCAAELAGRCSGGSSTALAHAPACRTKEWTDAKPVVKMSPLRAPTPRKLPRAWASQATQRGPDCALTAREKQGGDGGRKWKDGSDRPRASSSIGGLTTRSTVIGMSSEMRSPATGCAIHAYQERIARTRPSLATSACKLRHRCAHAERRGTEGACSADCGRRRLPRNATRVHRCVLPAAHRAAAPPQSRRSGACRCSVPRTEASSPAKGQHV